jgi:hypothetical protein
MGAGRYSGGYGHGSAHYAQVSHSHSRATEERSLSPSHPPPLHYRSGNTGKRPYGASERGGGHALASAARAHEYKSPHAPGMRSMTRSLSLTHTLALSRTLLASVSVQVGRWLRPHPHPPNTRTPHPPNQSPLPMPSTTPSAADSMRSSTASGERERERRDLATASRSMAHTSPPHPSTPSPRLHTLLLFHLASIPLPPHPTTLSALHLLVCKDLSY